MAPTPLTLSTIAFNILFSSSRNICICCGSLILISALISVFSISKAEFTKAIFAFSIFFGIPACTTSLSRTIPLTSLLSLIEVPGFFSTLILSKSTLNFLPSSTLSATSFAASTTIFANDGPSSETSFEYILVLAIFVKTLLSFTSTFIAIFCKSSRARSAAAV